MLILLLALSSCFNRLRVTCANAYEVNHESRLASTKEAVMALFVKATTVQTMISVLKDQLMLTPAI